MGETLQFKPKMQIKTKLTTYRHFNVVRRPSGKISIEFASEHLDEYGLRHFSGLAKDAAEAMQIALRYKSEWNDYWGKQGSESQQ